MSAKTASRTNELPFLDIHDCLTVKLDAMWRVKRRNVFIGSHSQLGEQWNTRNLSAAERWLVRSTFER